MPGDVLDAVLRTQIKAKWEVEVMAGEFLHSGTRYYPLDNLQCRLSIDSLKKMGHYKPHREDQLVSV